MRLLMDATCHRHAPMIAGLRSVLMLIALASTSVAWSEEGATPRSIKVDGVKRKFNLFAAPSAKHAPLIITLHGHGQSARQIEELSGWNAVAAEHGAVVAYPLSRGAHWRVFGAVSSDVDFLLMLIDRLATDGLVDPARVFVNGYSGGAQMSWRFACQAPTRVLAAGFVAGAAPNGCGLGRKPAVIMFHGEKDLALPYRNKRGTLAIPDLARDWAAREGCLPQETVLALDGPGQREEGVQLHHWSCNGVSTVELYSFQRGGHDWPGHQRSHGSVSVNATMRMWDFFEKQQSCYAGCAGPAP